MKILLSPDSKKKLLQILKKEYNCSTLLELAGKVGVKKKTLEGWFYIKERCIPHEVFAKFLVGDIKVVEKKEDYWGQIQGGKKGYEIILKKYGAASVKEIQSLGGKNGAHTKDLIQKQLKIDIEDNVFLEIYGALLGDGWLNSLSSKNGKWLIGLCGNLKLDKQFILYHRKNIQNLVSRKGYLTERKDNNTIEFVFRHKWFFKFLNEELKFPAGLKNNLKIADQIYSLDYNKVMYVIRGIFDTDGSFYLEKNRKGIPVYPCISIHMKAPILIGQLYSLLVSQGFRVSFERSNNQIKLKGSKQLKKWMDEIGSSNLYKLKRMRRALNP
ncbi:MAG: hypothetical protein Q8Q31_03410 [Nanoarchaeota archaeon]|nr:hypothetical protein [Nanoarchaeota archaeon]